MHYNLSLPSCSDASQLITVSNSTRVTVQAVPDDYSFLVLQDAPICPTDTTALFRIDYTTTLPTFLALKDTGDVVCNTSSSSLGGCGVMA